MGHGLRGARPGRLCRTCRAHHRGADRERGPGPVRRQISGAADQDHRAVRAGRLDRHPGSRARPEDAGELGPAGHRRDAARRRHRDRHRRRRAGPARRLHAAHHGEQSRHQPGAAADAAVRRAEGLRAGQPARPGADGALRAPEVPAEDHQGADRVRQDQSGAVRLRRHRQHDASRRRVAQGSARHHADAACGL